MHLWARAFCQPEYYQDSSEGDLYMIPDGTMRKDVSTPWMLSGLIRVDLPIISDIIMG
jgi:hypothetical protein